MAIDSLDVLYVPSRDVEADVTVLPRDLDGRVIFAIEAMGTRVAEVALAQQGPHVLLAEHLPGDVQYFCTAYPRSTRRWPSLMRAGCGSKRASSCRSARAQRFGALAGSASGSTSSLDPRSTNTSPAASTSAANTNHPES